MKTPEIPSKQNSETLPPLNPKNEVLKLVNNLRAGDFADKNARTTLDDPTATTQEKYRAVYGEDTIDAARGRMLKLAQAIERDQIQAA